MSLAGNFHSHRLGNMHNSNTSTLCSLIPDTEVDYHTVVKCMFRIAGTAPGVFIALSGGAVTFLFVLPAAVLFSQGLGLKTTLI